MTMQTDLAPHADINELLELLLARIQGTFGKKLIGLCLFGSLVAGDFDYESSDIDLIAALSADLGEKEEDLMQAFQALMKEWREWIKHIEVLRSRNYQAFVILTMCRALYTFKKELPERSSLIRRALIWRDAWRDEQVDGDVTLYETLRFVHFALNECEKDAGVS